jgi:CBS domain-containing protein
MGFSRVYRYTPGKMDWFAAGLPREGEQAGTPRVGDLAVRQVPTCAIDDTIGEAKRRATAAGIDVCVVTNRQRVVLGMLWGHMLERDPRTPVEEVMDGAPSTVRPNAYPEEARERMRDIDAVLVTTSDGQLIGLYHPEEKGPNSHHNGNHDEEEQ